MLYPVGFKPEDFKKPLIGIASTWSMVTPCNMCTSTSSRWKPKRARNEAGRQGDCFQYHQRVRRNLHGIGRDEIFAGVA